jgi:ribonuclease HI
MCILVKLEDVGSTKVAATTSLKIAEFTEIEHKNVLQAIENLMAEFSAVNFCKGEYKKRGRSFPMYILDEEFTSTLIMEFKSPKARVWKREYIKAFQELRDNKKVQRVKGDEPSELNRLVNELLEGQIKHRKPCHFDYSSLAREINIATFGHHEKDIRQNMTEDEARVLRGNLRKAGIAIAREGLHRPRDIREYLNRPKEVLDIEQKN